MTEAAQIFLFRQASFAYKVSLAVCNTFEPICYKKSTIGKFSRQQTIGIANNSYFCTEGDGLHREDVVTRGKS